MRNSNRSSERTLFLEEVVALETGAEAIKGLAGLADPESDGVECSAQCSHLVLCCVVLYCVPLSLHSDSDSGGDWWCLFTGHRTSIFFLFSLATVAVG